MKMKCIFNIIYWKKNISILAKATQVSDVAHGPLVWEGDLVIFHEYIVASMT
jgi:hypothetical protein